MAGSTERLYAAAQAFFIDWCLSHAISFPPPHDVVAEYLTWCIYQRGPSTAAVHLAAIGRLYREAGLFLDTKAPVIQEVMTRARRIAASPTKTR